MVNLHRATILLERMKTMRKRISDIDAEMLTSITHDRYRELYKEQDRMQREYVKANNERVDCLTL